LAVDLHVHTNFSDGKLSPEEAVRRAENRGLKGLSITDHDTVGGVEPALKRARRLELVPGVELSTVTDDEEIHILGYYVDYKNFYLLSFLDKLSRARVNRLEEILTRLAELGYGLEGEKELKKISNPGRMHVARALVKEGFVADTDEAFALLLKKGRPAYVPRYKISPEEGVELILQARGLPVIAHPIDLQDISWVERLQKKGLVGIEVYHPRHPLIFTDYLLRLTREKDLIATGGSDCHGPEGGGRDQIGSLNVPDNCLERLQNLRRKKCYEKI